MVASRKLYLEARPTGLDWPILREDVDAIERVFGLMRFD